LFFRLEDRGLYIVCELDGLLHVLLRACAGLGIRAPLAAASELTLRKASGLQELGIDVIAEGVETEEEYAWLTSQGIHLFQGYLLAKPAFECFPPVHYPET
jgi:hypothetical protein